MKVILENQQLSQCENFLYLDGIAYQDANCTADVVRRIGLASGIVSSLSKMWEAAGISKTTKVFLHKSTVQAIVVYNSATCRPTVRSEDNKNLRVFEVSVLRKICGLSRRNRRRHVDIMKEL